MLMCFPLLFNEDNYSLLMTVNWEFLFLFLFFSNFPSFFYKAIHFSNFTTAFKKALILILTKTNNVVHYAKEVSGFVQIAVLKIYIKIKWARKIEFEKQKNFVSNREIVNLRYPKRTSATEKCKFINFKYSFKKSSVQYQRENYNFYLEKQIPQCKTTST